MGQIKKWTIFVLDRVKAERPRRYTFTQPSFPWLSPRDMSRPILWLWCISYYSIPTILNYALASQVAGEVKVIVETEFGRKLGFTFFTYVDEMREIVHRIVKDPILQSSFFSEFARHLSRDNNITQALGPLDVSDQGKQKICCVIFSLPH